LGVGTYSLELTTNDRKVAVAYTLNSSVALSQVECSSYSYPGTLQESDWSSINFSDAHYTDLFNFTLSSPTVVVLDAASEQEGLCLYMYDESKPSGAELIASSCNDTYPFIANTKKYLGVGTYTVELTTNDPNITLGYEFNSSVELLQTPPSTTTTTITIPGGCPAEAIYGEQSEQAGLLRDYRDNVLSKTHEGQKIIKTYYKFSPTVTRLFEHNPKLKNRAKVYIDKMLPGIRKRVEESKKSRNL
jgi:hypothetical protein